MGELARTQGESGHPPTSTSPKASVPGGFTAPFLYVPNGQAAPGWLPRSGGTDHQRSFRPATMTPWHVTSPRWQQVYVVEWRGERQGRGVRGLLKKKCARQRVAISGGKDAEHAIVLGCVPCTLVALYKSLLYFTIMAYRMISAYSLSLPLLSLHFRNMTEASTFAGEKVLGSLSKEITLSRIVLGAGGERE